MDKVIDGMLREIQVNDDYAKLVYANFEDSDPQGKSTPIIKMKTMNTTDYMRKLNKKESIEGIFPPNCRHIEPVGDGYLLVIEEPPAYRTISVNMSMSTEINRLKSEGLLEQYGYTPEFMKTFKTPYKFTLAMPYVIFILVANKLNEIKEAQVFVRPHQLSGFSDYIYRAPFTNIAGSQGICLGDKAYKRCRSLQELVSHIIMVFWSAEFNTDYLHNYDSYRDVPILNSYMEWQYMSQANPMFIYNAEWMQYGKNLGEQIGKLKDNQSRRDGFVRERGLTYNELADVFYSHEDTGVDIQAKPTARKKQRLYYDISQSLYLSPDVNVNVGDCIEMKNGSYAYLDSLAGFMDGGDVTHLLMECNRHTFHMKFNDKCHKFILDQLKKQRHVQKATLPNGVVVKPGDIIKMMRGTIETYRKVDYIRKSRGEDEEVLEIKIGRHFYLTNQLEAEVFDIKDPTISGIKMNKKDVYILNDSRDHSYCVSPASLVKYDTIVVGSHNKLTAKYMCQNKLIPTRAQYINLDQPIVNPLINHKEVKSIDGIFRVGRKLFIPSRDGVPSKDKDCVWAYNGRILYESVYSLKTPTKIQITNLIKDGRTFSIPGPDFDTTFTIGDKVVVADWSNPINVLNIKELQGFKNDTDNGDIYFILSDREGNLSQELYVRKCGTIYTGRIRRVTNKFENLHVGTKIMAKQGGIANFPMKDVNIIVAFIVDGPHEPLALCSNGCTLWHSTIIKDFTCVKMKSKKWSTMPHVPLDVSKINLQAGDVINGQRDYKNNQGYLIFGPSTTRALRALALEYYTGHPDSYCLDKYFMKDAIFDCIPNPRIGPKKQTELGTVKGYFDFHGSVIENHESKCDFTFINERGDVHV